MKSILEFLVKQHILHDKYITGKFYLSLDECKRQNGLYIGDFGDYIIIEDKDIYLYDNWDLHVKVGQLTELFTKNKYDFNKTLDLINTYIQTYNTDLCKQSKQDIDYFQKNKKWAFITDKYFNK